MDFQDALKAGGASATLIAIAGIVLKVIQSFCGHRVRSECCGHTATAGVAVEAITPPHTVVEVPASVKPSPSIAPTTPAAAPPAIVV